MTWLIFNIGSVMGSAITLGQNWAIKQGHVTDGTYAAFIALETLGAILCCFIVSSDKVIRSDGTRVQKIVHPGLKADMIGLWTTLRTDLWILLLFPMFFASNYYTTYQFNDVNAYYFSTRTRAFNNLFYWISQILAALLLGWFLDWTRYGRRTRALIGWVVMFVLVNAVWGGGAAFLQKTHRGIPGPEMDLFDHNYFWYLLLYMCYGVIDSFWQTYVYYTMGAMSNSPHKLAYYTGFYKSLQAAGAATISGLDGSKDPFAVNFGSSWGLMAGGLLCALPVYIWRIRDSEVGVEVEVIKQNSGALGNADSGPALVIAPEEILKGRENVSGRAIGKVEVGEHVKEES